MHDGATLGLIAGVFAFHLYDSLLLLYCDDVLVTAWRRGWRASLGSGFLLGGRFVACPGWMAPGTAVFRVHWGAPADPGGAAWPEQAMELLRPLQWPAAAMAALLFGVLPVAVLARPHPVLMLALLASVYATASACVLYLVLHRVALRLSWPAMASIALDVLACPPFAINVVRRVSLRAGTGVPAEALLDALLSPAAREALVARARARMRPGGDPLPPSTPPGEHPIDGEAAP